MPVEDALDDDPTRAAVPLSPLQRAVLLHDRRSLTWTVSTPLPVATLLERVGATLPAFTPLRCALVDVSGLRLPRQRPEQVRTTAHPGGGWEVAAGATTLRARPDGDGSLLTVTTDPVFADDTTLEAFLAALAGVRDAGTGPDFLTVAAGHQAMQDDGELADELTFWDARRRAQPAAVDLVAGLGLRVDHRAAAPGPEVATASVGHLPEAARERCTADLAHLALGVLVDRLSPEGPAPARLVDVRALMGLEHVPGMLSQILPDQLEIDGSRSPAELLDRQRRRHQQQDSFAGGPALRSGDALPPLVLDPRTRWSVPAGWRVLDAVHLRSGVVVLRFAAGPDGARVSACPGVGVHPHTLRALVAAWAHLLGELAAGWERPCDAAGPVATGPPEPDGGREPGPVGGDLCRVVHDLALADGEAPALRRGGRVVTRRELLGAVGALLAALDGIGPGSVVAVLAPAGVDLVTAMVAALWRGACFLPLDPGEPELRLREALTAAGARHVVVGGGAPAFEPPPGCELVAAPTTGAADPGPPAEVPADAIAYLLRTSGSTGRPKIVPIRRDSLVNHLRWASETFVGHGDTMPVVSSPVFDASLKQLLGPLWAGRPVHLLRSDRLDVERVHAELAGSSERLVLNCVPSYWSELLRVSEAAGPLPLRRLLLGGEPVHEALLARTAARYPDAEVWNLYGPTEATVTTTAGRLAAGEPVHVGTPVAGATVSVVDRTGHALPPGLRGEVWIQGPGLSPGYLRAGPAEAAAFVGTGVGGRRAYRTGDRGCLDDHGRLVLSGRGDDQVKIRGWRIETGEVEEVAARAPGVDQAAVVVVDDGEGGRALRLFTTGDASSEDVRRWLAERLPAAIVPGSVVTVGRLPLTASGKVDRHELLRLTPERAEVSPEDYTPGQRVVAAAWRDVLGGPWPHVDDEFFAVGGHSLLLARLVNRLRAQGHVSLSLRQVVRRPTVASIAANVAGVDG